MGVVVNCSHSNTHQRFWKRMYVRLLLLSFAAGQAAGMTPGLMMNMNMNTFLMPSCFGESNTEKKYKMIESLFEQCDQTAVNDGLRKRRQAEDFIEAQELKDLWTAKLSNVTCMFKGMGMIDDKYNIQRDFFQTDIWQMLDLSAARHLSDPVWREKLSQAYSDCADIAEPIPQMVFDNDPEMRILGPLARYMDFWKCAKKAETTNCLMAEYERWQRKYYPNCLGGSGASVLGVRDKYEEALACRMTIDHAQLSFAPNKKFVMELFYGENPMI